MKQYIGKLFALLCTCTVLISCLEVLPEPEIRPSEPQQDERQTIDVRFEFMSGRHTKSSADIDEESINEVFVAIYSGGTLCETAYSSSGTNLTISLLQGLYYNVYAIVNGGDISPEDSEEQFLASAKYSISSLEELDGDMLMTGRKKNLLISSKTESVTIEVLRLTAKIWFSVDDSALGGVNITSVRLCQCANGVDLFTGSEGSRAEDAAMLIDGDYASPEDLEILNAGGKVYFYALENNYGTLLPGNADPWGKVPEKLAEKADFCTYLEVEAEFGSASVLEGNTLYRMYLGHDNCSNFDLRRNTEYDLSLIMSDEGLDRLSWKVESDYTYRSGFIESYQSGGPYPLYDLYVGLKFDYTLELSAAMENQLKNLDACYPVLISDDEDMEIRFTGFTDEGLGTYSFTGTCFGPGAGELWLYDAKGKPVQCLDDDVYIEIPVLALSEYSSGYYEPDENAVLLINGDAAQNYVYLLDWGGDNLKYPGYLDLAPFDFAAPGLYSSCEITSGLGSDYEYNEDDNLAYIAEVGLTCENDGEDHELNLELAEAIYERGAVSLSMSENRFSLNDLCYFDLNMQQVRLELVDNAWASYHNTEMSLIVDNPSKLPLDFTLLAVYTDDKNKFYAPDTQSAQSYINSYCNLNDIQYISYRYKAEYPTVYGNVSSVYMEGNSYGNANVILNDGRRVYPINNVSINNIYNSIKYFSSGKDAFYCFADLGVVAKNARRSTANYTLYDHLDDGSTELDYIYSKNNGCNYQGLWRTSETAFVDTPDTFIKNNYPDINASKMRRLYELYCEGKVITLVFGYNTSSGALYVSSPDNSSNVSMQIKYEGVVTGYVQTYPNGTWNKAQDNYCSAEYTSSVYSIVPGTTVKSLGTAVKSGMDKVYAQTFFDSHNKIGSSNNYMHSAHPTSVTCVISVKTANDESYYPVSFNLSDGTANYYHAQEATTYTLPVRLSESSHHYVNTVRK